MSLPTDLRTAKLASVHLAHEVQLGTGVRSRFVREKDLLATADRTQVVQDLAWFDVGQSVLVTYRGKAGPQTELLVLGAGDRVLFLDEPAAKDVTPAKAK